MKPSRIALAAACLCAAALGGVLCGVVSTLSGGPVFRAVQAAKRIFVPPVQESDWYKLNSDLQLVSYRGRRAAPAPLLTPRSRVLFTFGQSNAANSGGERYQGAPGVTSNYFEGKFYEAADPLLGATGVGGSVWVRTANLLIEHGSADQVVIMAAGVGSTAVADWADGGRLHQMLLRRLDAIPPNMPVTDFLWHQGESDNPLLNRAGFESYERNMRQIIALTKQRYPKSNFILAVATRKIDFPASPELQALQRRLALLPGASLGPDTDSIGPEDRHDGTHFSGRGLELHAAGWSKAIENTPRRAE